MKMHSYFSYFKYKSYHKSLKYKQRMLLNVKDMVCNNNNKIIIIIIIIILIFLIPSGIVDISSCTESIASLSELRYLHLKN